MSERIEGISIVGNLCEDNGKAGIQSSVSSTTGTDGLANSIIVGNICRNNSTTGIKFVYGENLSVTGNLCEGNTSNGIVCAVVNSSSITGNTCCNNGANGISIINSDENIITDTGISLSHLS